MAHSSCSLVPFRPHQRGHPFPQQAAPFSEQVSRVRLRWDVSDSQAVGSFPLPERHIQVDH